jgi:hypothetical protein
MYLFRAVAIFLHDLVTQILYWIETVSLLSSEFPSFKYGHCCRQWSTEIRWPPIIGQENTTSSSRSQLSPTDKSENTKPEAFPSSSHKHKPELHPETLESNLQTWNSISIRIILILSPRFPLSSPEFVNAYKTRISSVMLILRRVVWQPWSGNPVSLEWDAAAAALTEERPSCLFVLASQKKVL